MSATALYRTAAILFVLFAAGHTVGFLTMKPPTAEALAVHQGMTNVHFAIGGKSYTYGGFYNGFGLYISVYLLFSAFLSWHLGSMARTNPKAIGGLGWIFFAAQLATLALTFVYFGVPQITFSAVLAICLGLGARAA